MASWDLTTTIDAGAVQLMVSYSTDPISVRQVLINDVWAPADEILCPALIKEAEEQIGQQLDEDAEEQRTLELDYAAERAEQVAGMRA